MKALYLYIHIPFCRKKCHYCDFYSIIPGQDVADRYLDALKRAVSFHAERCSGRYELRSIYFGGGTPNLLLPGRLEKVFDRIVSSFRIAEDAEITIEINPEFAHDKDSIRPLADTGFNRLSVGVQSLRDDELRMLGRLHDRDTALRCLEAARNIFPNLSADLIFALPGQRLPALEESLDTLLAFAPEHLSAYNLSCEPGTPLSEMVESGKIRLADEACERRFFLYLHETLGRHGYRHYEISGYARPGRESRHNSAYWSGADYLGLGPSAHSKLADTRHAYDPDLNRFLHEPCDFHHTEKVNDADLLITRLRTAEGVSREEAGKKTWKRLKEYAGERPAWFSVRNDRIACTPPGWLMLDSILLDLI
ncbi:MAG: radical SAM family heme chaperone HemW [Candidatus Marinimicrobia bacterium]|nr:radical SAM family heme chaperone HemW [Candidatus Neomarinimicrobiota bacterium]